MRRQKLDESNPVVFFDISINDLPAGRVVFELYAHALPKVSRGWDYKAKRLSIPYMLRLVLTCC